MENSGPDVTPEKSPADQPSAPAAASGASHSDEENPSVKVVSSIVRRWEREDLLKKSSLALRAATLFFTLLSFIIMATNNHGDWKNFNNYQEYRYCLAIAIISILYTGAQVFRQVRQISTGECVVTSDPRDCLINFLGDQVMAYLLISAASAAIPLTDRMREGSENLFTEASAASITMAFFAFIALAISAMISGFKLSTQNLF